MTENNEELSILKAAQPSIEEAKKVAEEKENISRELYIAAQNASADLEKEMQEAFAERLAEVEAQEEKASKASKAAYKAKSESNDLRDETDRQQQIALVHKYILSIVKEGKSISGWELVEAFDKMQWAYQKHFTNSWNPKLRLYFLLAEDIDVPTIYDEVAYQAFKDGGGIFRFQDGNEVFYIQVDVNLGFVRGFFVRRTVHGGDLEPAYQKSLDLVDGTLVITETDMQYRQWKKEVAVA